MADYEDDDALLENEAQDRRHGEERIKKWDMFKEVPRNAAYEGQGGKDWMDYSIDVIKVFAYVITFFVVLAGAVASKLSLLLMTSHIKEERTVEFCNKELIDIRNELAYEAVISDLERVSYMWAIMFAFAAPEIQTFFRSIRLWYFKTVHSATWLDFAVVSTFEIIQTVGIAFLVFVILPELNVVKGAMIGNAVCLLPAIFSFFSRNIDKENPQKFYTRLVFDVLAIVGQLSAIIYWIFVEEMKKQWHVYLIPVAAIMVSCGWWENYATKQSTFSFIKSLAQLKERLNRSRYSIFILLSWIKIIVFFCCMLIFSQLFRELDVKYLFNNFKPSLQPHSLHITSSQTQSFDFNLRNDTGNPEYAGVTESWDKAAMWIMMFNILGSYAAYIFGKFACKIKIQEFSFALPVSLTVPALLGILIWGCGAHNDDACILFDTLPSYLYWECPKGEFLFDLVFLKDVGILWYFWLLSQAWITLHIWTPKSERLAATEKLFVNPMYSAFLVDQSMAMNRRIDDEKDDDDDDDDDENDEESNFNTIEINRTFEGNSVNLDKYLPGHIDSTDKELDQITRIYGCATMWHENREEMTEMMKSVFRLDEDQSTRRIARSYLGVKDDDYYEIETHILFDDAFELDDVEDETSYIVNQFVKILVNLMNEAGQFIHQSKISVKPPVRYPTPYGGRLVWTLPGKTRIVCHLKNKSKIRHRKRWSQVMYMYYLLGYRLMELPLPAKRKDVIALNTYLLALDGDVDFQPEAIRCLVDLMRRNTNLGAACGRIHPTGSGPMQWYQMFEYAVGHWLQKATEHVIGCVLCSPGCFSLFRASALMSDNVMKRYTTMPTEPVHYLQYDQGEDRWLCTLLLQQGFRVEYAAASDAFTQCPETFNEFYNQRRRWVPSTIANILDLLFDYKETVKVNDNISRLYIGYQIVMMVGSILGPGTIFLMLVGAFNAAFKISNWNSFIINAVPLAIYIIACYKFKSNIQLMIAQILTYAYVLVMLAVIVATALQMEQEGFGSPSGIFFIGLFSSFFICAVLHPKEFWCLPALIVYYLTVPSMYLLLIIYSLFNMNNVSWGTREVANQKKTAEEVAEERRLAQEAAKKKKKGGLLRQIFDKIEKPETEGSIDFSFAGLFRIMCCTKPKTFNEQEQLVKIAASLDNITRRLDAMEMSMDGGGGRMNRRSSSFNRRGSMHGGGLPAMMEEEAEEMNQFAESDPMMDDGNSDSSSTLSTGRIPRDELISPYWIEDKIFSRRSTVDFLETKEVQFWKDLIEKYLYPLLQTPEQKKKQEQEAKELLELRNKSVFTFMMFNLVFILVIYTLQLNKDTLFIYWPFNPEMNVTFSVLDPETYDFEVVFEKEFLQLEPIGLVFVFFFAIILVVQFVAMLIHRFGTISQILANHKFDLFTKKVELSGEDVIHDNPAAIVREIRDLNDEEDEEELKKSRKQTFKQRRRKTIQNLERQAAKRASIDSYDGIFMKRLDSIVVNDQVIPSTSRKSLLNRRDTIKALSNRRESMAANPSKFQTRDARTSRASMSFPGKRTSFADEGPSPKAIARFRPPEARNGSIIQFADQLSMNRIVGTPGGVPGTSILKNPTRPSTAGSSSEEEAL